MNTLFKTFLIAGTLALSNFSHAREIILIENLSTQDNSQLLSKILMEKFNIPESFIKVKDKKSCKLNSDAIMHLCLRADGELDILKLETYAIENMLRSFLEMER